MEIVLVAEGLDRIPHLVNLSAYHRDLCPCFATMWGCAQHEKVKGPVHRYR